MVTNCNTSSPAKNWGFRQDVVITDGFAADPTLKDSERIAREVIDQLLADKFGFHVLPPATVKVPVTKVVID